MSTFSSTGSPPRPARAVDAINAYIRAKDGNRPHGLFTAFIEDAVLTIQFPTESTAPPSTILGRTAIAETLVRRFSQAWENIYTLCIGTAPIADAREFSCDWLMVMSAKQDGGPRVGCGRYDWTFEHEGHRASSLNIRIDAVEALTCDVDVVTDWISALPYPWCARARIIANAPDLPQLRAIFERLKASA